MYCSEIDCGNNCEMNPDDDDSDDDLLQDPLAFVTVNYDVDASKEDSVKNDTVILQNFDNDGEGDDGLLYDPDMLSYEDALTIHVGSHFNPYEAFLPSISSEISRLEKPPYSFNSLIAMAIENSEYKLVTVPEICQFISSQFPYYDMEDESWKSHVRYTLTTQRCFISVPYSPLDEGLWQGGLSGPYWTIDKDYKARSRQGQRWGSGNSLQAAYAESSARYHDISRLRKPPYSYTTLIAMAIEASEGKMATLADIYKYISSRFPYYDLGLKLWQNSIRHFLSVTKYFVKVPKENAGRGHYWTIGVPPSEKNYTPFQSFSPAMIEKKPANELQRYTPVKPKITEPEVTITPLVVNLPSSALVQPEEPEVFLSKLPVVNSTKASVKPPVNTPPLAKTPIRTPPPVRIPATASVPDHVNISPLLAQLTQGRADRSINYKKPPFAFTSLISMAIENSSNEMATLGEIYDFISSRFPFYGMYNKGWQNTVRHFLSVTNYFVKVPRKGAKGNYWKIEKSKKKSGGHKVKREFGSCRPRRVRKTNNNEFICILCTFKMENQEDAVDHMVSVHGVRDNPTNLICARQVLEDRLSRSPEDRLDSESTESCKEFPDSPSSHSSETDDKKNYERTGDKCECQPSSDISCQVCSIRHNHTRSHLVTSNNKKTTLTC